MCRIFAYFHLLGLTVLIGIIQNTACQNPRPSCQPNEFRCMNGQCIHQSLRFNGKRDCLDNSDEVTGQCFPKNGKDYYHCGDDSNLVCVPLESILNCDTASFIAGQTTLCIGDVICLFKSNDSSCSATCSCSGGVLLEGESCTNHAMRPPTTTSRPKVTTRVSSLPVTTNVRTHSPTPVHVDVPGSSPWWIALILLALLLLVLILIILLSKKMKTNQIQPDLPDESDKYKVDVDDKEPIVSYPPREVTFYPETTPYNNNYKVDVDDKEPIVSYPPREVTFYPETTPYNNNYMYSEKSFHI